MSWKTEWKTIFWPEWASGGLDITRDQVALRLFDNFESPATTSTISTAWTGTNVTVTRETTAPLNGEGSMSVAVAGGAGSVYKALDRAKYGYPFPGHNGIRIRYVKFRATTDSGNLEDIRVTFGDVSDANHYRYWTKTVGSDKYQEFIVDLDPDNEQSNPAPTEGSTTFDPEIIDRFGFTNLTSGSTYLFDDLEFVYEFSLVDTVGFPTEAPVDMGDVGSLHARINGLWANVKALEGQTQQYAKQGIAVAEIGQACQWALELNSEFAPPTTTEIVPGNYQIDRISAAVTTNIVASTPASESTGTIYASYTIVEADWDTGDLAKITFSGGYIRTDEGPTELLTATVAAGGTTVTVDNAYQWQVGWLVRIYDDDSGSEWHTIASIDTPTTFTIDATTAEFTVAQNGGITRSIRTDLSTAVFFTMVQEEAASYRILARGTFTTSSAIVPADTSRSEADDTFNGCLLMPVAGTYADVPRRIVDFANTGGVFTINGDLPFPGATGTVEYVILGDQDLSEYALGADNASNAIATTNVTGDVDGSVLERIEAIQAGLGVVAAAGTGFEEDGTGTTLYKTIVAKEFVTTAAGTTTTVISSALTEANDYWNGNVLIAIDGAAAGQVAIIVDYDLVSTTLTIRPATTVAIGNSATVVILQRMSSEVPTADATENYQPRDVIGNKSDTIPAMDLAPSASDSLVRHVKAILERIGATSADPDDSLLTTIGQRDDSVTVAATATIVSLLRNIHAALSIVASGAGGGFEIDGSPSLTNALGTTGAAVTDSATSVLGAVGADNNNNAFASTSVVANSNGSVLERLEHILVALGGTTGITTGAGTTATAIDTVRTEAADYWNGGIFLCVDGANAGLARPIYDFDAGADTLYFEPAFPNAVAASVNYLILARYDVARLIGADNADNAISTSNVIGNVDGSVLERIEAVQAGLGVVAGAGIGFEADGTGATLYKTIVAKELVTTAAGTTTTVISSALTEANDYWNGNVLIAIDGAAAGQVATIVDYDLGTTTLTIRPATTVAIGSAATVVILQRMEPEVPSVDSTENYQPRDVIGNKSDAIPAMNAAPGATDSIVAHAKAILERIGATPADPDDSLHTIVGQRDATQAAGVIKGTDTLVAMLKQVITQQGLIYFGDVTTYTDVNTFASLNLAGYEDGFFENWYVYCVRDDAGASAAPQNEYRLVTAYVSVTGTFTHNALSVAMEVGDQVQLIHPLLYEVLTIRGGAYTLQDIMDEHAAEFDYSKGPVTVTLDGTEQSVYDSTSVFPFHVKGLWIGMENMVAADGIVIKLYNDWDDASIVDQISDNAVWTWGGVQSPTWVYREIDVMPLYEFKITVERIAGANTPAIYFVVDDGKRGS